jgi:hypothetical protein
MGVCKVEVVVYLGTTPHQQLPNLAAPVSLAVLVPPLMLLLMPNSHQALRKTVVVVFLVGLLCLVAPRNRYLALLRKQTVKQTHRCRASFLVRILIRLQPRWLLVAVFLGVLHGASISKAPLSLHRAVCLAMLGLSFLLRLLPPHQRNLLVKLVHRHIMRCLKICSLPLPCEHKLHPPDPNPLLLLIMLHSEQSQISTVLCHSAPLPPRRPFPVPRPLYLSLPASDTDQSRTPQANS